MAITDYQPQRTPEGTSPPLRLWLDTEHRRIALAIKQLVEDIAAGGGGVTDHGALTGLSDDDHPQYPLLASPETISGAWTFSDTVTLTDAAVGALIGADNSELRFGTGGDDLAVYHDGTDNHIDSNTGTLIVSVGGNVKARFRNSASVLELASNDSSGDTILAFFESNAFSTRKGYVGFGGAATDTLFLWNEENADTVIGSNSTERLRIQADGAWEVEGDTGASGEFLKSTGSGGAPVWAFPAGLGPIIAAWQDADLVITSNAAFQDTDLVVALTAGSYKIEARLFVNVHATPDMEVQMTYTGTTTTFRSDVNIHNSSTSAAFMNYDSSIPHAAGMTSTAPYVIWWSAFIEVSDSGNVKIQARQISSSGTAVTFFKGSWIQVEQLS